MIKRFFSVLFMCSLFALTCSEALTLSASQDGQTAQESESAQEGVRAAINHYFKGHATGDASHMRKAFLPTAHIEGIREGKFISWTLDEYCALFKGKPAGDESTRVRRIDMIDVSGNSAMAKATLVHGVTMFTDYFVLLKVGDEWKIANKVYYGRRNTGERR
ncbi:MAG TPA: nuclear transport factor 2 family protein [Blastocatellia bacterium]|nr:nuclear transport factor 2 family protein [Blastocatellia bacterium]